MKHILFKILISSALLAFIATSNPLATASTEITSRALSHLIDDFETERHKLSVHTSSSGQRK